MDASPQIAATTACLATIRNSKASRQGKAGSEAEHGLGTIKQMTNGIKLHAKWLKWQIANVRGAIGRHRRMPHGTRSPWSMNATATATATNLQQHRQPVAHSMRCPLQPGAVLINLNVASKQRQLSRRIGNRASMAVHREKPTSLSAESSGHVLHNSCQQLATSSAADCSFFFGTAIRHRPLHK